MKHFFTIIIALIAFQSEAQTANFWTKKNDFSGLKRSRAVAFTVNDMAYVGTGVDTAEMVRADFWEYDPVLDTWAQVADLPATARRNAVAFSIGSKGYVGSGMSHAESSFGSALNDFWEYDPASNLWTSKATIPSLSKYFGTGFSVNGKGYIACGKIGPNYYSNGLVEYDPVTDTWSNKASFPGGVRYQLSSLVIDNKAYVGLGTDQDMYRNDWWEYDPATDTWQEMANLPASERSASHTFTLGQRGFVCMGNNGGLLDDLWEYNPFDDKWESRASYGGTKRKNGVAFSLLGKGYVGTGKGYSGKKMSFQEYTPGLILGVDENGEELISVFPNPATNVLNMQTESNAIEFVEIYSLDGKMVHQQASAPQIDISQLISGTYILVAKNIQGQAIANKKIHKQ